MNGIYADPTFEAAHRAHEAWKRRQRRPAWGVIMRRRRRIQRLLQQAMDRHR